MLTLSIHAPKRVWLPCITMDPGPRNTDAEA